MGLSEILAILLSLSGFGIAPSPASTSAAELTKYAPDDSEIFVYLDWAATVPGNWAAFEKLPQGPAVRASPKALRTLTDLVAKAKKERNDVKAKSGFDGVNDVKTMAAFITLHGDQKPDFLIVLRGSFTGAAVEKAVTQAGTTKKMMSGHAVMVTPDGVASALAPDGSLFIGTELWVKERLVDFAPKKSALVDIVSPGLDAKPFFYFGMRLSPASLLFAARSMNDPVSTDLLGGIADFAMGLHRDGVSATFGTRTPSAYARGLLATDGVIALLRAGHQTLRGIVYLTAATIDSLAKTDPVAADVAAHKTELLALFDSLSGDGNFQATVDRKEAQRRVDVRLTGRSISDVLPATGFVVPLVVAGYLSYGQNAPH